MSTHVDLLALLRGDLSNDAAVAAGSHLRSCEDCARELVDSAVGHSVLAATARTLSRPDPVTVPAPQRPAPEPPGPRVVRALPWAAAAVAIAGVGLAVAWLSGGSPDPVPTDEASAQVSLVPLTADGAGAGVVRMTEKEPSVAEMTIRTEGLPPARGDDFYYAWLLDPATQKMLPLGQVGLGDGATFEVSSSLLGHYSVVDISLEADDGDPAHSVTSVLRATYDPRAVD